MAQALYHNRELSWLQFNERVLDQAAQSGIPLLERIKFVSIFCNNLDEFFMIRVGTLTDAKLLHPDAFDNKMHMSPAEQLKAIFGRTRELLGRKDQTYLRLVSDLKNEGIEHLCMDALTPEQEQYLCEYFTREILPVLSPQIIDKHHPFPFLKNKEIYICTQLKTKGDFVKLAIIPVSTGFNRVIYLPFDKDKFVLLEDLVYRYCEQVFESYTVVAKTIFRIVRNADINVDEALYDYDMDYRSVMEEMVKNRRKLMPVCIEFQYGVSDPICEQLRSRLELERDRVFISQTPTDMSFGFTLAAEMQRRGRRELFYRELRAQEAAMIEPKRSMIAQIEERDLLLCYPFESMKPFLSLLLEAASDESVISIKMTLYRVARESQVVAALIKAAENGKSVHVVVELRARFDEENNIVWSRRLEEAGVNVVYGLGEYKVHSKLLVITRQTEKGISLITQVGTGNYNESTAKLYTDLSLMTANREFGEAGLRIFNGILTDHPAENTAPLLAAPITIKPKILSYIDREIAFAKRGEKAAITVKINSLTDKEIIDRLMEASRAGVKIDLIVRGICCLRVGIPGETDNIRVISIVGRFLEHSRVYMFGPPERCDIYISSADFMTRNTERRVEVAALIYDEGIKRRIIHMLQIQFLDNCKAQQLMPDGSYCPVKNDAPPTDSQFDLFKAAYLHAEQKKLKQVHKPSVPEPEANPQPTVLPEPETKQHPLSPEQDAKPQQRESNRETGPRVAKTPTRQQSPLAKLLGRFWR